MTDVDNMREQAQVLTQVAELLETVQDTTPDANVEHEIKDGYASVHITFGTKPTEDAGDSDDKVGHD